MDILAHALYGVTFFSRSGLAGKHQKAKSTHETIISDWTLWAAAAFSVLPDLASIGVYFAIQLINGSAPSFHSLPPYLFLLYHYTHSLVIAFFIWYLLYKFARPLAIPALAWLLHIIMDSFSHGEGKFQTLLFYPLSSWHFNGLNWWQNPHLIIIYWGILPVMWGGIYVWKRKLIDKRRNHIQ